MDAKKLRDLIREEIQQVLNERQYMPDDSLKSGDPEKDAALILTPNEIRPTNNTMMFTPKPGNHVEFDVPGLKYGSGKILGYSVDGDYMYIELPTGNYIKINLLVDGKSIKRIEIENWVIQQKV